MVSTENVARAFMELTVKGVSPIVKPTMLNESNTRKRGVEFCLTFNWEIREGNTSRRRK